ncbi:MAG: DUF1178 family protein [Pseudomonadota bacterium]|nr:DUF1178 family protein [Pseudomonadota bacterium]
MIKYKLICDEEHEFEGWFGDSSAFEAQQHSGLLSCPVCGCGAVRRALMAPNLASPKTRKSEPAPVQPADQAPPSAAALPPEAARRMHELMTEMRALQTRIKDECRDVGSDFAEEARKIHYGEVEPEGIYGHATTEEREALDEEGIDVLDMPWLTKDN